MPSSSDTYSSSFNDRRVTVGYVRKYRWPPLLLNLWLLIMLGAACAIIGIFSTFIDIQNQLQLPIPWCVLLSASCLSRRHSCLMLTIIIIIIIITRYLPYYITVGSLVVTFILSMIWMISQRRLLPAIVFVGAFILLVLWIIGMVVVAIQLFGGPGINGQCGLQVFSQSPTGQTLYTLAWLQQRSICQAWHAVFAMALVGSIFLVWIMFMSYQVFADS
jgi:hypothetical protein